MRRARRAPRLGLAATLGQRLREVGEHDGEPEPEGHGEGEPGGFGPGADGATGSPREPEDRGEHAADLHHEHDRVADLVGVDRTSSGSRSGRTRRGLAGRTKSWSSPGRARGSDRARSRRARRGFRFSAPSEWCRRSGRSRARRQVSHRCELARPGCGRSRRLEHRPRRLGADAPVGGWSHRSRVTGSRITRIEVVLRSFRAAA